MLHRRPFITHHQARLQSNVDAENNGVLKKRMSNSGTIRTEIIVLQLQKNRLISTFVRFKETIRQLDKYAGGDN